MGQADRHGPVRLRVAATARSIEPLFAPLLVRLDPGILWLDLAEAGGGEVLSLVMSGAVDAAATSQPPAGTQVMTHPIATLHMRAYARPDLLGPGAGPARVRAGAMAPAPHATMGSFRGAVSGGPFPGAHHRRQLSLRPVRQP